MSLEAAQRYPWNLASALVTILIVTDSGSQAMPSDDHDGSADDILREHDPWSA